LKPPLRFLAKATSFGTIFIVGVVALGSIKANRPPASNFMAIIADKHARLAAIPSPRILLGGGSNFVFGVDSAAIEQTLQLPVVNVSLHAGLGLQFILREMQDAMRSGDIVVLSIEYDLPLRAGQYSLARAASDAYPPALGYYQRDLRADVSLFLERRQASLRSLFSRTRPPPDPIYTRSAFTERGDGIGHLGAPQPAELRDRCRLPGGRWEGVAALNDFADAARRQNVRVFFVYPSYSETEYEKNRDIVAALDRDLRATLRIELLGSPRDAVYPDDEFFDTIYHLNGHGRQRRTHDVMRLLQAKLPPLSATAGSAGQASR
jgi:hypothetical protein